MRMLMLLLFLKPCGLEVLKSFFGRRCPKISPRLRCASAGSEKGGCEQKQKAAGLISVAV